MGWIALSTVYSQPVSNFNSAIQKVTHFKETVLIRTPQPQIK
jgi:hypothetical protein